MKSGNTFSSTLSNNICQSGVIEKLSSDRAQVDTNNKVKDILRSLLIDGWKSDPFK